MSSPSEKTARGLVFQYLECTDAVTALKHEMAGIESALGQMGIDIKAVEQAGLEPEDKEQLSLYQQPVTVVTPEAKPKARMEGGEPYLIVSNWVAGLPAGTEFSNATPRQHLGMASSTLSGALHRIHREGVIDSKGIGKWVRNDC